MEGGFYLVQHDTPFTCTVFILIFGVYSFAVELNRLNEKLTETEKVKMELQLKLDDVQSCEASAQVFQRLF